MGTGSLVGVPSGEIVAQKAAAGIGDAHGSVDEGLDLQIVRDMFDRISLISFMESSRAETTRFAPSSCQKR